MRQNQVLCGTFCVACCVLISYSSNPPKQNVLCESGAARGGGFHNAQSVKGGRKPGVAIDSDILVLTPLCSPGRSGERTQAHAMGISQTEEQASMPCIICGGRK